MAAFVASAVQHRVAPAFVLVEFGRALIRSPILDVSLFGQDSIFSAARVDKEEEKNRSADVIGTR